MAAEVELKLALAPADVARLRRRLAAYATPVTEILDNIYFDTSDRLLARHRLGLRLRRQASGWVQTLKAAGADAALSRRGEWEMAVPLVHGKPRLALDRLGGTPLAELLAGHAGARLEPVFETRFRRTRWEFDVDAARVEVALDRGDVVAGAARAPILELELELKAGAPAALLKLALELAEGRGRQAPLVLLPATESKATRGYRLALGADPAPAKAGAQALGAPLDRALPARVALRQVVNQAAAVIAANERGMAGSIDPEFVHQARVALRRLRSAVRLLDAGRCFPPELLVELRWLGGALGAARDADVRAIETLPALLSQAQPAAPAGTAQAWLARAEAERQVARQELLGQLASPRYSCLALRLLAWAHSPAEGHGPSVGKRAGKRLGRLQERLLQAADGLAELSAERLHRVRVEAKRLRYGIELLASGEEAAPWLAALARVQSELGASRDAAACLAWIEAQATPAGADWAAACLQDQQNAAVSAAEQALAGLRRLKRWHF